MKVPVYSIELDENDETAGLTAVSFVDEPAIESNFVAFSKEKQQELKFNKYKQQVTGPVLIPDKKILRFSAEGIPYFISFSSAQIEKLRDKFHKDKLTDKTNINHSEQLSRDDMYVLESWIIADKYKDKSQVIGLEKLPVGSWVMTYKVPDPLIFNKILSGELNGFSIEAFLDIKVPSIDPDSIKPKKIEQKKSMNKFEKFFNSMKQLFSEVENNTPEVKLATYQSGEMVIEVDDETGQVLTEGVEDGTYEVEGGTLAINSGIAVFLPAEEAPTEEEQPSGEAPVEEPVAEDETEEEPSNTSYILENGDVVEVSPEGEIVTEGIADGEYVLEDGSIMVVAEDRLVEILNLEAQLKRQIEALQKELNSTKAELSKTQNEKTELETKLSKLPAGKKIVTQELQNNKVDLTKMTVAERYAYQIKKQYSN